MFYIHTCIKPRTILSGFGLYDILNEFEIYFFLNSKISFIFKSILG